MNRREFLVATAAVGVATGCGRRSVDDPTASTSTTAPRDPTTPSAPTANTTSSLAPAAPPTTPTAAWSGADFAPIDRFLADTGGRAAMVIERGVVVHEWYRDGDASFSRDIASAQKSVLSILVGIAVDRELLTIDTTIDSVLGGGWATGDTSAITVLHLLTMTSGIDLHQTVVDQPGRAWRYNDAFAALFAVLETVADRPLNDLATEWLFDPIGATGAEFRARRANVAPGVAADIGLLCTAQQLAAVGLMILGHRERLVSDEWLTASLTPSQSMNPAYGFLWWLNGQSSYLVPEGIRFEGPLIPAAPADLVAALGRDDQKLYISRELDLVAVRLGDKADRSSRLALSSFDNDLWSLLLTERNA